VNKIVFVTLMVWVALTAAAGFAAGQPALRRDVLSERGDSERVAETPAVTWTCAHNTYRSVACR
jgi:hypothetical protein